MNQLITDKSVVRLSLKFWVDTGLSKMMELTGGGSVIRGASLFSSN